MKDKLESIIDRHNTIEKLMADQEVLSNPEKLKEIAKEYKQLEPIVITGKEYIKVLNQIIDSELIIEEDEPELKELAVEDLALNKQRKIELEKELTIKLLPKDPLDNKNIILEIRAGTGGDEAALFAADLFRLYSHFSEKYNWQKKLIASNEIGIGGFKEVIIALKGVGAYGMLKYESGVHRVQRVPETETGGRVHTSAATVAVLPEAEEVDVEIHDTDLKIDTYRASGAGGQHVNKTDSAVRITHIPSKLVVQCQSSRSQHRNKSIALEMLKSKLYELQIAKEDEKSKKNRSEKGDIGWGNQIRSYVMQPYTLVKDHRTNTEVSDVNSVLNGELDKFLESQLVKFC